MTYRDSNNKNLPRSFCTCCLSPSSFTFLNKFQYVACYIVVQVNDVLLRIIKVLILILGIAASKGNQILGLIRRNITYKGKKLIIPLYKAIVRPHLEYCIQTWRPYRKKDIDTLERIQRRATEMIPELRDLSYEERLKECGLTTLETRRLRGDQIEVFKILNGYENIDRNMFFSLKKDSRTRGHEVKLVKDQCRLDIRKHSFSQRTINEWNKLSTDCVTASSVNNF